MVLQQVPDHQHALLLPRQRDERRALVDVQRERLFDEHVLAAAQEILGKFGMLCGRRGDRNGEIGRHVLATADNAHVRIRLLRGRLTRRIGVADHRQRAERVQIAGDIAAPGSEPHERDLDGGRGLRHGHLARRM